MNCEFCNQHLRKYKLDGCYYTHCYECNTEFIYTYTNALFKTIIKFNYDNYKCTLISNNMENNSLLSFDHLNSNHAIKLDNFIIKNIKDVSRSVKSYFKCVAFS